MALSRRGRRKIVVQGREYLWWVAYDWDRSEGGGPGALHVATLDRAFEVALSLSGFDVRRLRVVSPTHFTRGEVERGALLRCDVGPRDVYVLPGDVRRLIDWCQTPGPLKLYEPASRWPPPAPDTSIIGAVQPLIRALHERTLEWSYAACDEDEQPLEGSPLALYSGGEQVELWASGGLIAASRGACALERRPADVAPALAAEVAWLMNPGPMARLERCYLALVSMYVEPAGCRMVILSPFSSVGAPVYVAAVGERLVVSEERPAVGGSFEYRSSAE